MVHTIHQTQLQIKEEKKYTYSKNCRHQNLYPFLTLSIITKILSSQTTTGVLLLKKFVTPTSPFAPSLPYQMVHFPQYHSLSLDARRILFTRAFLTLSEKISDAFASLQEPLCFSFFSKGDSSLSTPPLHSATCATINGNFSLDDVYELDVNRCRRKIGLERWRILLVWFFAVYFLEIFFFFLVQ